MPLFDFHQFVFFILLAVIVWIVYSKLSVKSEIFRQNFLIKWVIGTTFTPSRGDSIFYRQYFEIHQLVVNNESLKTTQSVQLELTSVFEFHIVFIYFSVALIFYKFWSKFFINVLTLFRMGWGGATSFCSVTSVNVGISPQNFLTFSFNPCATLV